MWVILLMNEILVVKKKLLVYLINFVFVKFVMI